MAKTLNKTKSEITIPNTKAGAVVSAMPPIEST